MLCLPLFYVQSHIKFISQSKTSGGRSEVFKALECHMLSVFVAGLLGVFKQACENNSRSLRY